MDRLYTLVTEASLMTELVYAECSECNIFASIFPAIYPLKIIDSSNLGAVSMKLGGVNIGHSRLRFL
jgi:hypothetical protein